MCNELNRSATSQRRLLGSTRLHCNTDHVTEMEGGRKGGEASKEKKERERVLLSQKKKKLKNHKQAAVKPQCH